MTDIGNKCDKYLSQIVNISGIKPLCAEFGDKKCCGSQKVNICFTIKFPDRRQSLLKQDNFSLSICISPNIPFTLSERTLLLIPCAILAQKKLKY